MKRIVLSILAVGLASVAVAGAKKANLASVTVEDGLMYIADGMDLVIVDVSGDDDPLRPVRPCDLDEINGNGGWSYKGCSTSPDGHHSSLHFGSADDWCVINVGAPCADSGE